ncbi:MAG TPA: hypothetical protein RMH99_02510 [Sandaracinaceae bacterium LLY-WYZ-13_1]|nr:hypothetical protein [Sandaracinaceae bacterium LLY-WYZ-13_1]
MNLTSTLLKAGALYALGRFASNVSAEDVTRVTGISGEDLKSYGINRADALLGTMGLQRQASVPNSTALVLSGFAAGAIVGAGATFLFYSEQGKEVRKSIAEYFSGADQDEGDSAGTSTHAGNGEAKANA